MLLCRILNPQIKSLKDEPDISKGENTVTFEWKKKEEEEEAGQI